MEVAASSGFPTWASQPSSSNNATQSTNQFEPSMDFFAHGSSANPNPSASDKVKMIWGTNIVLAEMLPVFRRFINEYTDENGEHHYLSLLRQAKNSETYILPLDCSHLSSGSTSSLYAQLLHYPQEIIPLMDLVVNDIFSELFPEVNIIESPIQIRPFNIGKTVNARLLDPSGTLVPFIGTFRY
jgi:DNA replication licensing factor MCM4